MAQRLLKPTKKKVAAKKEATANPRQIVLVGTYKERQLAWIRKNGVYNYPVKDGDEFDAEAFAQIRELWLYADAKGRRYCFAAEFVGRMPREEYLAAYPSYADLGRGTHPACPSKGRATSTKESCEQKDGISVLAKSENQAYYVFKTAFLDYGPNLEAPDVLIRAMDFATGRGRTRAVKKAYDQFKADGEFAPLAAYLPTELSHVPRERLRVCEASVQLDLFEQIENARIMQNIPSDAFTAVELFAGAGGLSIGLEKAGIHVVIANEIMPDFAATLVRNHPRTKVINEDIHKIDFADELSKLGLASVDVLSGGPPCQGFSTIGSKNRKDPRNSLFYEYLRAVAETHPKYTIFENVSGFKRMYDGFAYKTLVKELDELGYDTDCQILNAADYGAPQIRYRTIVLGWRKGLAPLAFPAPTHGTGKGRLPYVTLIDAIGDLPPLNAGESVSEYTQPPMTDYQRRMRGSQTVLLEHNAANYGAKMQEILQIIPEGGCIKDLPERLRPKSAYANTYARLLPDVPSPTITRNFGTPSSSRCVHPYQARALSTREGARLQGFPDGYAFVGGKQSKNLQIGNAVPPILGEAIAKAVKKALEGVA